jgi:glycerol-3-phosphate dehydrogenase
MWDRGVEAAEPAARLMAEVLGWDEDRIAREVDVYHGRVAAERRSQEQPDDRAADLARTAAPDARPPVSAPAAGTAAGTGSPPPGRP